MLTKDFPLEWKPEELKKFAAAVKMTGYQIFFDHVIKGAENVKKSSAIME